ncbi:MAG: hypothetical protein WC716_07015 [Chitinophagaceae bacterium]|jgi:NAD-dependent SIR2 family protein deacetylase
MTNQISFLLGSGFSIPEGLPSVTKLNQRLSKIQETEILIHSSQVSFFLNGQEDNNRYSNRDERLFLQDFLDFYSEQILDQGEHFHYEKFYDFYSDYLYRQKNIKEIEGFYSDFVKKHSFIDYKNCLNCIADFNRTFNQLIAGELQKRQYFQEITFEYYPQYNEFIKFIASLSEENNVKIHTLNHDMFFDYIGENDNRIAGKFSDGYTLEGSPFYGNITFNYEKAGEETLHKSYKVKLPKFTDSFNSSICFYKLHGSVMTHIVYVDEKIERIKYSYGAGEFSMERYTDEESPKPYFDYLHSQVEPDFLSGTTHKITRYAADSHYINLFNHFQKNLEQSKALIVIGYGFQDGGINDILITKFLSRGGKMIVIDPYKPNTSILDEFGATFIKESIVDVTMEEFGSLNL